VEPKIAPGENGVTMGWYEGEWSHGKYHGRGKIVWGSTGQSYEGEFADGQRHGRGILRDAKGNILQQGEWAHNSLVKDEILEVEPPPLLPQVEGIQAVVGEYTVVLVDGKETSQHDKDSAEKAEVCHGDNIIETDTAHQLNSDIVSNPSSAQHNANDSGQELQIALSNFEAVTLD
jgi:hypothetical protein